MRVLVTASRRWDPKVLAPVLLADVLAWTAVHEPQGRLTIIHGNARGGDQAATIVADMLGANLYRFPAEWEYYGSLGRRRAAGVLRNAQMLNEMPPNVVLAYPLDEEQRGGTWDMVNLALKRGFAVEVRS